MAEAEEVCLRLTDAVVETVTVTPLGDDRYRLEDTPVSSFIEEMDVYYGDVIKATCDPDGSLRFHAVIARSGLRLSDFIVGHDIGESDEFCAFADAVNAAGGYCEWVFGGVLFVYIPDHSPFDPAAELDKVVARVKARKNNQ